MSYFDYLGKDESEAFILEKIPKEIIDSFSSIENIFSEIELPNCPDCDLCELKLVCKTTLNFDLAKKIAKKMKEHCIIDQSYLREFTYTADIIPK